MLTVKNWKSFQHYKKRSPPWIKLHRSFLDDYAFQSMPDASKALAPCLWLIASESQDGTIDMSIREIAFRLRMAEKSLESAIIPLINRGFLIDDSNVLAECKQDSLLETETEREIETEREEEYCPEPDIPASEPVEVVITIPIIGNKGTEFAITKQHVQEWEVLYPNVDVPQTLNEIRGWNLANPAKRKTKSGILRHVNSWLMNAQNGGR